MPTRLTKYIVTVIRYTEHVTRLCSIVESLRKAKILVSKLESLNQQTFW